MTAAVGTVGQGSARKTILLVDDDPHARAVLRRALEGAGFDVGEAANGGEGVRTALRIKPSAMLVDMILETLDDGDTIAATLQRAGLQVPIYVVSTAGDALAGAVGLAELGISGLFLKPADPAIIISMLKMRLG